MMLLDELNRDFPNDWGMRSSIKRKHQLDVIAESKSPQDGVYWWRPSPVGWVLESFYFSEFPEYKNHYEIWQKWAGTILGVDGVIPRVVLEAYCGIPRGRIVKQPSAYVVMHGNDLCDKDHIDRVIADFNLPPDKCNIQHNQHEDMVQEHRRIIEAFLGRTLVYG